MDYLTGDLGQGGARECATELRFRGVLGDVFVAFAVKRALRLSLRGWIEVGADEAVTVVVEGPEALVDAFEIVCSLGPIESVVDDWNRENRSTGLNTLTFERRL